MFDHVLDSLDDELDVRECRLCGCTDEDACVDAAGVPCSWTEDDLCSVCAALLSAEALANQRDGLHPGECDCEDCQAVAALQAVGLWDE